MHGGSPLRSLPPRIPGGQDGTPRPILPHNIDGTWDLAACALGPLDRCSVGYDSFADLSRASAHHTQVFGPRIVGHDHGNVVNIIKSVATNSSVGSGDALNPPTRATYDFVTSQANRRFGEIGHSP